MSRRSNGLIDNRRSPGPRCESRPLKPGNSQPKEGNALCCLVSPAFRRPLIVRQQGTKDAVPLSPQRPLDRIVWSAPTGAQAGTPN